MCIKSVVKAYLVLVILLLGLTAQQIVVADTLFINGEDYRLSLSSGRSTKYLAVAGGGLQSGANVILWQASGQDDIRWVLHHLGSSRYKIQNRKSGRYLAVSAGSRQRGANIIQWTDEGQRDVIWEIRRSGSFYTIKNVNSRLYLAASGGQIRNGGNIIQWTNVGQSDIKWRISQAPENVGRLNRSAGRPVDYGYASKTVRRSIPALLMLTEFSDSRLDQPVSFYDNLIFGPSYPNIKSMFRDFSNNRFNFTKAGTVRMTFDFPMSNLPADFDAISIRRALQLARIDPAIFDNNPRDGNVTENELVILSINANLLPGAFPSGQTRGVRSMRFPGVNMNVRISSTHMSADINLYAHELFHLIGRDGAHIYGPTGAVNLRGSLYAGHFRQSSTPGPIYLDPYNRIKTGWVKPRIFYPTSIKTSTWIDFNANASRVFSPVILQRTVDHGRNEFFVLEYRNNRENQYDAGGLGTGLAIWYVKADRAFTPVDFSWPPPFAGGTVPRGTHIFANFLIGTDGPGTGNLWNTRNGVARLNWGDGTDSGIRVRVRADVNNKLFVEWWVE